MGFSHCRLLCCFKFSRYYTDITDMTLIISKQLNITSTSDIATRYFTVYKKEILTDTHFPPFTTNNNS